MIAMLVIRCNKEDFFRFYPEPTLAHVAADLSFTLLSVMFTVVFTVFMSIASLDCKDATSDCKGVTTDRKGEINDRKDKISPFRSFALLRSRRLTSSMLSCAQQIIPQLASLL